MTDPEGAGAPGNPDDARTGEESRQGSEGGRPGGQAAAGMV